MRHLRSAISVRRPCLFCPSPFAEAVAAIRVTMATSVGIPAASLCINHCLYQIASVRAVTITQANRRAALIETLICVLCPLVYVALDDFHIHEQIGCYPALLHLYDMATLLGLVSGIYSVLSLRAFLLHRVAFAQFLSSRVPRCRTSPSRYLRLMALTLPPSSSPCHSTSSPSSSTSPLHRVLCCVGVQHGHRPHTSRFVKR
ncbi:pheromone A receptor-domain-containing protein [Mycena epipterygia]|nr:pheromone A receptor-domain-containing protein [Mycena epipterygia]